MSDESKSFRKGVNLNLGKTFESGLNLGFDSFIGETTETGKYNMAPKKTKDINVGVGATTKGGTRIRLDLGKCKSSCNYYYPERTEKSAIISIGKQFNTGGDVQVHRKGVVDKDLL